MHLGGEEGEVEQPLSAQHVSRFGLKMLLCAFFLSFLPRPFSLCSRRPNALPDRRGLPASDRRGARRSVRGERGRERGGLPRGDAAHPTAAARLTPPGSAHTADYIVGYHYFANSPLSRWTIVAWSLQSGMAQTPVVPNLGCGDPRGVLQGGGAQEVQGMRGMTLSPLYGSPVSSLKTNHMHLSIITKLYGNSSPPHKKSIHNHTRTT